MGSTDKVKVLAGLVAWCILFVGGGCTLDDETIPVIVNVHRPRPVKWVARSPYPRPGPIDHSGMDVPRDWLALSGRERKWTAIIVHHSDTETGCAASFDKYHRDKGWAGVGYDFVIGNGTGSGDGQVEPTFRWHQQITGAHCKTPNNWANEWGVGICLVGDFDYQRPTAKQVRSLLKLVRFLQKRYGIPKSRIYGHQGTPGARVTDCPGKRFSVAKLRSLTGS